MSKEGTKTASVVSIKNWDDWFDNCRELRPMLENYEADILKYYDMQFSRTEAGEAAKHAAYESRHQSGFYRSLSRIPGWKLRVALKLGALIWLVFAVIFFVVFLLLYRNSGISAVTFLIQAGLRGLGCGIAVAGVTCGLHVLRVNGIMNKMDRQEDRMRKRISYVPPKYRNSAAVGFIYDLYARYGSVITYSQALDECDSYLQGNNLVGAYLAVMFNEPFDNASLNGSVSGDDLEARGLYQGAENPLALKDENLPQDIQSKTFAGMENAEEELAKLVG